MVDASELPTQGQQDLLQPQMQGSGEVPTRTIGGDLGRMNEGNRTWAILLAVYATFALDVFSTFTSSPQLSDYRDQRRRARRHADEVGEDRGRRRSSGRSGRVVCVEVGAPDGRNLDRRRVDVRA